MTCGIRRTSCVHPVGRKTSWKTSPKPLVPQALRGLELPHAENDGRATRRQLRRRTDWGNSDRPTRFDWDSRPRRERSAGHGARSSTAGTGQPATAGGRSARSPRRMPTGTADVEGFFGARPAAKRTGNRQRAVSPRSLRQHGRWSVRKGQPDRRADERDAGPSISYIEGPAPISSMPDFAAQTCTTRRGTPQLSPKSQTRHRHANPRDCSRHVDQSHSPATQSPHRGLPRRHLA